MSEKVADSCATFACGCHIGACLFTCGTFSGMKTLKLRTKRGTLRRVASSKLRGTTRHDSWSVKKKD